MPPEIAPPQECSPTAPPQLWGNEGAAYPTNVCFFVSCFKKHQCFFVWVPLIIPRMSMQFSDSKKYHFFPNELVKHRLLVSI